MAISFFLFFSQTNYYFFPPSLLKLEILVGKENFIEEWKRLGVHFGEQSVCEQILSIHFTCPTAKLMTHHNDSWGSYDMTHI